jgi:diadenosine tetraphosphate (Ap4A) HIT family hydrolase
VFCAIVNGTAQAAIVHSDDLTVAFRDIRPLTAGHTLVVPRTHEASVRNLDTATASAIWNAGLVVARLAGIAESDVSFWLADGSRAGQEVMHAHLHVLPRTEGDGLRLTRRR